MDLLRFIDFKPPRQGFHYSFSSVFTSDGSLSFGTNHLDSQAAALKHLADIFSRLHQPFTPFTDQCRCGYGRGATCCCQPPRGAVGPGLCSRRSDWFATRLAWHSSEGGNRGAAGPGGPCKWTIYAPETKKMADFRIEVAERVGLKFNGFSMPESIVTRAMIRVGVDA